MRYFKSIISMSVILLFYFSQAVFAQVLDSLTFIGHSSVKIKTADSKVIYIDPYQPGNYSDSADVILVTHQHNDHNQTSLVTRKTGCQVITNTNSVQGSTYNSFQVGSIFIKAVPAYNDYHDKNSSVGYILEFNGIKVYHAGDTGYINEFDSLTAENIDYALLPIDGTYTMTPQAAQTAAEVIGAAHAIPIHTMPPTDNYYQPNVDLFSPANKLEVHHGETITLVHQNTTAIDFSNELPNGYRLEQNYPNPFNPSTVITYFIPVISDVKLSIYSIIGEEISTTELTNLPSGNHQFRWNKSDLSGKTLSSGIYVYQLKATGKNGQVFEQCKKMILLK